MSSGAKKIRSPNNESSETITFDENDKADISFEHRQTGAIISLNSVCKEHRSASLEQLSKNLLMGLVPSDKIKTRNLLVDNVPALESTVECTNPERVTLVIRTVVLKKSGCVYDLMYISKPEVFHRLLPDFDYFLRGFHAS